MVYVLTTGSGCYGDYSVTIEGVFSSRAAAEAAVEELRPGEDWYVEEFELDVLVNPYVEPEPFCGPPTERDLERRDRMSAFGEMYQRLSIEEMAERLSHTFFSDGTMGVE